MKRRLTILLILPFVLVGGVALAQWSPAEWVTHNYPASAQRVFAAALKSVQAQKHEIISIDRNTHTVDFRIGTAAWSLGHNMRLTVVAVTRGEVNISRVTVGGSDAPSSNAGNEVQNIFVDIDNELSSAE